MKLFLTTFLLLNLAVFGKHQWVQEEAILKTEDDKTFVVRIDEAQKEKDWSEVIDLCDELLETVSKAENKVKALVIKGIALKEEGENKEAFDTFQSAIDRYPMYMKFNEAVTYQKEIADLEYEKIKDSDSIFTNRQPVIDMYKKIVNNAPFADNAASILLRVAIIQKDDDQIAEAIQSYRTIVKRYRTTAEAGYARINLAQHYINLLDKIEGDQKLIDSAKSELILFTQQFKSHPMLSEAERRLKQIYNIEAERLYLLAVFYNRQETPHYRPDAAKRYLYKLLIEYGDSEFTDQAQTLLKSVDAEYQANIVDNSEKIRKEAKEAELKITLPPEATDKSKRKILIPQGKSDKFLLPVEDLDLTPLENNENKKSEEQNEKK
ncbi:MAG: tetratricopeptide repeat protein [Lentisphaeraceae bacterium]|nr:tetratricopeptide repeat protein [Lentisphaeraceae bacterium]